MDLHPPGGPVRSVKDFDLIGKGALKSCDAALR
jgi:hypothetical protein